MPIIYRRAKSSPLTIEEVDGNFSCLDERLKRLETEGLVGEGIARIDQEGDVLHILGSKGSDLGRFNLPKVFPSPRGNWITETAYLPMDWVQQGRRIYVCVKAHTSSVFATDLEATKWKLVFEVPA